MVHQYKPLTNNDLNRMEWTYNNREITEAIEGFIGFVYRITHIPSGKSYIGRKYFTSTTNVRMGKKELALLRNVRKSQGLRGRTPIKKQVVKESDWKNYYSSNKEIKAMVKEGKTHEFKREILTFCETKKLLTYFEMKYQFKYDVLISGYWFNDSIAGKFYTKDFENLI